MTAIALVIIGAGALWLVAAGIRKHYKDERDYIARTWRGPYWRD